MSVHAPCTAYEVCTGGALYVRVHRVSRFSNFFEFHIPNLGSHSILYLKEESKFSEFSDFVYYSEISRQNGSDPFISEKKIVWIIGFMVFKSTGSDSQFQHKNWFRKIFTES